MKLLTNLLLLTLLCSNVPVAPAQKRARKTRNAPTAICTVESVPKGAVVVGSKVSASCSAGRELLVKLAENGDIICAGSPLPSGFSVFAEAQGPMVGNCPSRAFLINDENLPAKPSELNAAALEAKCQSEVDKEIDLAVKNGFSEKLTVWLATATRTICLKSGGREH